MIYIIGKKTIHLMTCWHVSQLKLGLKSNLGSKVGHLV